MLGGWVQVDEMSLYPYLALEKSTTVRFPWWHSG